MSESGPLHIEVPEELADEIRQAVDAGEYESATDVISDALRQWRASRPLDPREADYVRRAWREGKASGVAGELDMRRIMAEARAKFEAKR